jgi:lipopolysaccharide export system protein LptA
MTAMSSLRQAVLAGVLAAALAVSGTTLQAQPNGPSNGSANAAAHAQQQPSGPPNALQGFSQNRDKPIKINSATLEVRDKDKVATFAGDVHLVQGDTTLLSKTLVVFYDDDPASKPAKPPAGATQAAGQQSQQIKRVEAKGDVIVKQKDQTATGDNGIFDMRANTVTLLGNVVISQGPNIIKGDKLTVDMTTGVSLVEAPKCAKPPCRVQALLTPSSATKPETHAQEPECGTSTTPGKGRCSAKPETHNQEAAPAGVPAPGREAPRQRSSQPSGLY